MVHANRAAAHLAINQFQLAVSAPGLPAGPQTASHSSSRQADDCTAALRLDAKSIKVPAPDAR